MASPGVERRIGGVKVQFPCRPYPSQFSMMNKIIQGLQRQQNCLLESPTGSGKSLALLCSCLAWQKNEFEQQLQQQIVSGCCDTNTEVILKSSDCQCSCHQLVPSSVQDVKSTPMASKYFHTNPPQSDLNMSTTSTKSDLNTSTTCTKTDSATVPVHTNSNSNNNSVISVTEDSQEDDDFKPALKKFRTKKNKRKKVAKGVVYEDDFDVEDLTSSPPQWKMEITNASAVLAGLAEKATATATTDETSKCNNVCTCSCAELKSINTDNSDSPNIPRIKVPKIFFGTRTHKQITQIIRELRKTAYSNVRMAILASREHYCVHPHVSKSSNKNEGCKQLLDSNTDDSCSYYQFAHKLKTQDQLRYRQGFDTAWDVEDLVTLGKKARVCPYFAVRGLMDDADIIFCPYNYLIDPKIRSAMEINLKDQIVVLDEAHNIEDSSRDAASLSLKQEDLEEAMDELDKMVALRVKVEDMQAMREMCVSFVKWINSMSDTLQQSGFEKSSRIWAGVDFVAVLDSMAISPLTIPLLRQSYSNIMADNFDPTKPDQPSLSSQVASLLEGIFIILGYLFKDNMKFMHDYRIAIEKTVSSRPYSRQRGGWMTTRRVSKQWTYSIKFWCLNPAVAFTDVSSCSRSIILTSGTLSPMASFSSELGAMFPIQLEANHIIHNSQVWVGTVATGPSGGVLNATYKYAETFSFQDEMGQLVLGVCRTIPHGVLCFLPSYNMMEKLCNRWKATGLWEKLEERKMVIMEPRGGDKADFDSLLKQFYDAITETEGSDSEDECDGALFFAVCRGKVSEGLDFADNNARAVITVGIPFPNIKDTVVDLKKKYNNEHTVSRGLLNGNEWYEIQAYRALNQALGRCIRHRQDWGALILVDERFGKNARYIKGLSKWVRHQVRHYYRCNDAMSSLSSFSNARLKDPCPDISLNTSIGPLTPAQCSQVSVCTQQSKNKTPTSIQTDKENVISECIDLTSCASTPGMGENGRQFPKLYKAGKSAQFSTSKTNKVVSKIQPSIASFMKNTSAVTSTPLPSTSMTEGPNRTELCTPVSNTSVPITERQKTSEMFTPLSNTGVRITERQSTSEMLTPNVRMGLPEGRNVAGMSLISGMRVGIDGIAPCIDVSNGADTKTELAVTSGVAAEVSHVSQLQLSTPRGKLMFDENEEVIILDSETTSNGMSMLRGDGDPWRSTDKSEITTDDVSMDNMTSTDRGDRPQFIQAMKREIVVDDVSMDNMNMTSTDRGDRPQFIQAMKCEIVVDDVSMDNMTSTDRGDRPQFIQAMKPDTSKYNSTQSKTGSAKLFKFIKLKDSTEKPEKPLSEGTITICEQEKTCNSSENAKKAIFQGTTTFCNRNVKQNSSASTEKVISEDTLRNGGTEKVISEDTLCNGDTDTEMNCTPPLFDSDSVIGDHDDILDNTINNTQPAQNISTKTPVSDGPTNRRRLFKFNRYIPRPLT